MGQLGSKCQHPTCETDQPMLGQICSRYTCCLL